MEGLTARQAEILDLIKEYLEEYGYPPTRMEIAEELGFRSPNAAEDHLKALAKKGYIEMVPGSSRGIRLPESEIGIPIVGGVAAGSPILAEENIDDYIDISGYAFDPEADYFLRVYGESMINVGIMDGDLLAVHKTPHVRTGDIVVARIDDEVTVKRLKRLKTQVQLLPENDAMSPIKINPKEHDFAIEGVAVGVLRTGGKLR